MTDQRRDAERDDRDGGSPPRVPRWVKIAAIVVGALLLVFLVLQLSGVGGQHGPGRHALDTSAGVAPQRPPAFLGLR